MSITSPSIGSPGGTRSRPDHDHCAPRSDEQTASGLLQLLLESIQAPDLSSAAQTLSRCLPSQLARCRMAIGLVRRNGTCSLQAVSTRNDLDHRSERVRAIESALDETVLAASPLAYPWQQTRAMPAKTLEHLAQLVGCEWMVSHPLRDGAGFVVGAMLVWGDGELEQSLATAWLSRAEPMVAGALEVSRKAHQSAWARLTEQLRSRFCDSSKRRMYAWTVAGFLALMAVPLPHKIHCSCVLEPVTRRYVAAPFEATLVQTLVEPGDVVTQGQPLVELDGREILWQIASLEAAYEKAQKSRDSALAERRTSESQLARLEMEQLEHQLALLRDRQEHLTIHAPFDGVVISGDLQRVEGAPVTTGQTLMEIAPLDNVLVEVAVPEQSVTYAQEEAVTSVTLEAFPGQHWTGTIQNIHPRAEIRGAEQVFVAELELANRQAALRPGMQGQARVSAGWVPTGWILFHQPYVALTQWLGW